MGIEHFVSVIDRASIDEVLSLSWKDFNRQYRWKKHSSEWSSATKFLQDFAYDPVADQSTVDDIMDRRTLRWTMNRCSPKLFFMYEIINHVPALRARCPSYTPRSLFDLCIVQAAGVEAFLRGDISQSTLFSILRFTECFGFVFWRGLKKQYYTKDWLDLKKPHHNKVVQALRSWIPSMPPFRWLSLDYFGEGYHCLNIRETKSIVHFLQRAWEGNWPAPHISEGAKEDLCEDLGLSRSVDLTVRDSDASRQILRWFRSPKGSSMCLVDYFEP